MSVIPLSHLKQLQIPQIPHNENTHPYTPPQPIQQPLPPPPPSQLIQCINPQCGAPDTDFIHLQAEGDMVCTRCGMVQEERMIDPHAEWNFHVSEMGTIDQSQQRCDMPDTDYHNPYGKDMVTYIQKGFFHTGTDKDGKEKKIDLSVWHIRSGNGDAKLTSRRTQWKQMTNQLEDIGTRMGLPQTIIDTAKEMWSGFLKSKKCKRSGVRRGIIACCILYACSYHRVPRERHEIINAMGNTSINDVARGDKLFTKIFRDHPQFGEPLHQTTSGIDLYARYCSMLGIPFPIHLEMQAIAEKCRTVLADRAPRSQLAAVACYVIKDIYNLKKPTKTAIVRTIGTCVPTVSTLITRIREFMEVEKVDKK